MLNPFGVSTKTLLLVALALDLPCIAAIYLTPRAPGRCRVTWLVCTLLAGPIGFVGYWWLKTPGRPGHSQPA